MAKSKAKKPEKEEQKREEVFISEADQYLFAQGTHYDIYKKLGAHLSCENGVEGVLLEYGRPTQHVCM